MRQTRLPYFFLIVAGFLGGVAFRSFFDAGNSFVFFLALLSAAGFFSVYRLPARVRIARAGALVVVFLSAGFGIIRFDLADAPRSPLFERSVGARVVIEGIVLSDPDERGNSTRIVVQPLKQGGREVDGASRVLVVTDPYASYHYGDSLRMTGTLLAPRNFEGENGREFDYVSYLAKDAIHYQMLRPEITLLSRGGGSALKRLLFGIKDGFLERLGVLVPEPHAALLGGLLVGAKQSLGTDLLEDFRRSGLTHIVVLSGYNLSIIAEAISRSFRRYAPQGVSIAFSAAGIALFAVLVGGGATVVRASVMALLVIVARATGRVYDITRALCLAAFIMVIVNPRTLVFDPSFQLSFLATVALIFLAPRAERFLRFVPERGKIRETAAATIATQLFVLPLLLFLTGSLSLVALPANLLVLPAVPFAMLFGFLAGAVGMVSSLAAIPFAGIAYGILSYILAVVSFMSGLPFAAVAVPAFSPAFAVAAYGGYGAVGWWRGWWRVETASRDK